MLTTKILLPSSSPWKNLWDNHVFSFKNLFFLSPYILTTEVPMEAYKSELID
jgi:hypothetical protein